MKTKEELNAIREEIAGLATKLKELSDAELEEVGGGYAQIGGAATPIGADTFLYFAGAAPRICFVEGEAFVTIPTTETSSSGANVAGVPAKEERARWAKDVKVLDVLDYAMDGSK